VEFCAFTDRFGFGDALGFGIDGESGFECLEDLFDFGGCVAFGWPSESEQIIVNFT